MLVYIHCDYSSLLLNSKSVNFNLRCFNALGFCLDQSIGPTNINPGASSSTLCIQVSCEEFPNWMKSCSLDPPTVNDDALDTWFKVGKVCMFVQFTY